MVPSWRSPIYYDSFRSLKNQGSCSSIFWHAFWPAGGPDVVLFDFRKAVSSLKAKSLLHPVKLLRRARRKLFTRNAKPWGVFRSYEDFLSFERKQGKFFARLILRNMPKNVKEKIVAERYSILDFGCGNGHLVDIFSRVFTESTVHGLDNNELRINQARKFYRHGTYLHTELANVSRVYDCVVTSNVLEHFEEPFEVVEELLLPHTKNLLLILVPFHEVNRIDGHLSTFSEGSFKDRLGDFDRIFTWLVDCSQSGCWHGDQGLVIYARRGLLVPGELNPGLG